MVWIKELSGLGFKKDNTNRKLQSLTFHSKPLDDPAVTQMDAIEIANGGDAALAWKVWGLKSKCDVHEGSFSPPS